MFYHFIEGSLFSSMECEQDDSSHCAKFYNDFIEKENGVKEKENDVKWKEIDVKEK